MFPVHNDIITSVFNVQTSQFCPHHIQRQLFIRDSATHRSESIDFSFGTSKTLDISLDRWSSADADHGTLDYRPGVTEVRLVICWVRISGITAIHTCMATTAAD